jgi:hypothetical protein
VHISYLLNFLRLQLENSGSEKKPIKFLSANAKNLAGDQDAQLFRNKSNNLKLPIIVN